MSWYVGSELDSSNGFSSVRMWFAVVIVCIVKAKLEARVQLLFAAIYFDNASKQKQNYQISYSVCSGLLFSSLIQDYTAD